MRLFKHHSIMRCIYAVLIALPMFSILGRVIYTQSNKNAKDSYYGETINQSQISYINDNSNIVINENYDFTTYTINYLNDTNYNRDNNYLKIILNEDLTSLNSDLINGYTGYLGIYKVNSWNYNIWGISNTIGGTNLVSFYTNNAPRTFKITILDYRFQNNVFENTNILGRIINNKYSYLDNAFDYSLSRFVDVNHWGKLDFFSWFQNLFIDINYNQNTLYLHFINWYMNYTMFVSCGYILFLVLMWFINYSRRILERGMNYDW